MALKANLCWVRTGGRLQPPEFGSMFGRKNLGELMLILPCCCSCPMQVGLVDLYFRPFLGELFSEGNVLRTWFWLMQLVPSFCNSVSESGDDLNFNHV